MSAFFESGMAHVRAGDWRTAEGEFARAMNAAESQADRANAATWGALCQLAQGANGRNPWNNFELRFQAPNQGHAFPRDDTYWCGEATESLLIWAEGGRGNVIQFCRYVADVAARFVLPVVLAVHPEMTGLARDHLVNEDISVVPMSSLLDHTAYTAHCSILSLPAIFAFKCWPDPAIPPVARTVRRRLPLRVGLNWQGNPSYWDDARRSFASYPFAPLEALIPKIQLVELNPTPAVVAAPAKLGADFIRETLGELENLDLVISTDTAMAHLSAHLGIPTWLLLHDACNWRWAPNGPAVVGPLRYDAIRIFRSAYGADLGGSAPALKNLIDDVAAALRLEVAR